MNVLLLVQRVSVVFLGRTASTQLRRHDILQRAPLPGLVDYSRTCNDLSCHVISCTLHLALAAHALIRLLWGMLYAVDLAFFDDAWIEHLVFICLRHVEGFRVLQSSHGREGSVEITVAVIDDRSVD